MVYGNVEELDESRVIQCNDLSLPSRFGLLPLSKVFMAKISCIRLNGYFLCRNFV